MLPSFTLLRFTDVAFFYKLEARPSTSMDYDSLYCGGLELNLQYLQGVPVCVAVRVLAGKMA